MDYGTVGNRDDDDDVEPQFGLEVDFAMAFHNEDEDDSDEIVWYLGHCMRMKGRRSTAGRRQLWREPFLLSERPDVHVIAKWYRQMPDQPLQFQLDVDDSRPYELKNVISIVNLEYDENSKTYSIAEDVRETLDVAVRSLRRSNAAGASAARVEQQQRRAEERREAQRTDQPTFVPGGTTRSGRATTRRPVLNN